MSFLTACHYKTEADFVPTYSESAAADLPLSQEKQEFAAQNDQYLERERLFMWYAAQEHEPIDVVFLGDSITQKFEWSEVFPGLTVVNRGIDSDTTAGALARLDSVTALSPKVVSCLLGINDISSGRSVEDIRETYAEIFDTLRSELPSVHIIVTSVFPVTKNHPIDNESVILLNQALAELCAEKDVLFLDIYDSFVDASGNLSPAYAIDLVHLSIQGYLQWLRVLSPQIYGILRDDG